MTLIVRRSSFIIKPPGKFVPNCVAPVILGTYPQALGAGDLQP